MQRTILAAACATEERLIAPRIFWIFSIWKTNRMTLFWNLFIEQPS